MKIRNGFVSNSSSSSFLVVMAANDYKNIINSLDPFEAAIAEQADISRGTLGGQECVMHYHVTGNYSTLEEVNLNLILERAKEIAKERNVSFSDLYSGAGYSDEELLESVYTIGFIDFADMANKLSDDDKAMVHSTYM